MEGQSKPTRRQINRFVQALIRGAEIQEEAKLVAEGMSWKKPPEMSDFGITSEIVDEANSQRDKGEAKIRLFYKSAALGALVVYLVPAIWILFGFFAESLGEAAQRYGKNPSEAFLGVLIWTMLAAPFVTFQWAALAGFIWLTSAFSILALKKRIKGPINPALLSNQNYLRACEAYAAAQKRRSRTFWESLSGHEFEQELANLLNRAGHKSKVTRASGDEGVDILCQMEDETVVFQCKRYQGSVGPAVLREMVGAMVHFSADRGVVATTGYFTEGAVDFADDKNVELWTLDDILKLEATVVDGRKA